MDYSIEACNGDKLLLLTQHMKVPNSHQTAFLAIGCGLSMKVLSTSSLQLSLSTEWDYSSLCRHACNCRPIQLIQSTQQSPDFMRGWGMGTRYTVSSQKYTPFFTHYFETIKWEGAFARLLNSSHAAESGGLAWCSLSAIMLFSRILCLSCGCGQKTGGSLKLQLAIGIALCLPNQEAWSLNLLHNRNPAYGTCISFHYN